VTYDSIWKDKKLERFNRGLANFNMKWGNTHYLIKNIILRGVAQYGKEQDV